MTAEDIIERLEYDSLERLRWLVLCRFGVLPGSKRARKISNEDLVFCGANMVIDARNGTSDVLGEGGVNAAFDEKRFYGLMEA